MAWQSKETECKEFIAQPDTDETKCENDFSVPPCDFDMDSTLSSQKTATKRSNEPNVAQNFRKMVTRFKTTGRTSANTSVGLYMYNRIKPDGMRVIHYDDDYVRILNPDNEQ